VRKAGTETDVATSAGCGIYSGRAALVRRDRDGLTNQLLMLIGRASASERLAVTSLTRLAQGCRRNGAPDDSGKRHDRECIGNHLDELGRNRLRTLQLNL
jgi:hypothetical protein